MQPVKDDCIDRSVILGSVPGSENLFLAGQILFKKMCRFLWALSQKLEKARALKQGMMQQLLTGKIRLPLAAGA